MTTKARIAFNAISNIIFAPLIEHYAKTGEAKISRTEDSEGKEIICLTFDDNSRLEFFDGYATAITP